MKISFSLEADNKAFKGTIALVLAEGGKLAGQGKALDQHLGGALSRALEASPQFKAKRQETLTILAPSKEVARVVLVGLGARAKVDVLALEEAGGAAFMALEGKAAAASLLIDSLADFPILPGRALAALGMGARLRDYRFDKYFFAKKGAKKEKAALEKLTIYGAGATEAKRFYAAEDKVADAVFWARDLISEPSNVMTPVALAAEAQKLAKLGVKVEILDEKKLQKLGMGALCAVAQGSVNPPRMVVLHWQGSKDKKPIALVGKGVTFDSGGISLKPSGGSLPGASIWEMKLDMSGAAAVLGTMQVLATRKAKANVVGVIGLVENMPSGSAMRPGDIVKAYDGQTIEIINTDAEGRLVLADALAYVGEKFSPRIVIDLATLTAAMIAVLGYEYAGLFANDDTLAEALTRAGEGVDEKLWRFPMGEIYDRMVDSSIADMRNSAERWAGSTTAAQFLKRFVKGDAHWAHLDIAGATLRLKSEARGPKGAVGFGVRMLDRFIAATEK